MELVIGEGPDGKTQLQTPEPSIEVNEKDWNIVQGFLLVNDSLWKEYFRGYIHICVKCKKEFRTEESFEYEEAVCPSCK